MNETKKKVLFVTDNPLVRAGVQAVIMDIVRNISPEYQFDILLTVDGDGYYDSEFESFGGKIFRMSTKIVFGPKLDHHLRGPVVYKNVLKTLRQNGPYEAIHCHNEFEAAYCLMAAKKAGVKVRVVHTHTMTNLLNTVSKIYYGILSRLIEKSATHKLGCSEQACEGFYNDQNETKAMNNSYDEGKFYFEKYPEEALDSPRLLQIGSFSNRKNQIFSIDVIAEIKKEYPNVKFDMVGFDIGNTIDKIKSKIIDLGLEDNVTIYPSDADSTLLLSKSSGSLIPSKSEAFGIVAIEAQAMGVKCYASDALPPSTNCGGCEYLPLSVGAQVWAKKIISDFKATGGKHEKYDCSAFSSKNVANEYRKIYGGIKL